MELLAFKSTKQRRPGPRQQAATLTASTRATDTTEALSSTGGGDSITLVDGSCISGERQENHRFTPRDLPSKPQLWELIPPDRFKATVTKSNALSCLSSIYRQLDDITARHAALIAEHCGGDPSHILNAGYGVVTPAFLKIFKPESDSIKRASIVLPCRNAQGEIIGDGRLRASLYGTVNPLAASPSALRQVAWESATEWLSHVQPVPHRPMRPIRRVYFPVNRKRRKPIHKKTQELRRAAAA
jgi:hypothetical protein